MALTQTQVSQLYVSIFGRASEGAGNTYWQAQTDLITAAANMLATPAAATYFGSSLDTDQAFIKHIYLNTLGKTYAEDTEGVDYWVSLLEGGKSRAEVVAALIEAAQSAENAGPAQDMFNNKVAVSDYVADTIATADLADLSAFTNFIKDVDNTSSSVDSAKADVDVEAAKPDTGMLTKALATLDAANTAKADWLKSLDKIDEDLIATNALVTADDTTIATYYTNTTTKLADTVANGGTGLVDFDKKSVSLQDAAIAETLADLKEAVVKAEDKSGATVKLISAVNTKIEDLIKKNDASVAAIAVQSGKEAELSDIATVTYGGAGTDAAFTAIDAKLIVDGVDVAKIDSKGQLVIIEVAKDADASTVAAYNAAQALAADYIAAYNAADTAMDAFKAAEEALTTAVKEVVKADVKAHTVYDLSAGIINHSLDGETKAGIGAVTVNYNVATNVAMTADDAKPEVQTFKVTNGAVTAAGDITIGGVTVAVLKDDTVDQIGAKIAAADYSGTTIAKVTYTASTDTVTVTYAAGKNEADITLDPDTSTTGVTFSAAVTTTTQGTDAVYKTATDAAALNAAITKLEAFEKLVKQFEESRELNTELKSLTKVVTDAEAAITNDTDDEDAPGLGLDLITIVDDSVGLIANATADAKNNVFLLDLTDNSQVKITNFGTDGLDRLYVGEDFTFVKMGKDDDIKDDLGSLSALEIFYKESTAGVTLYIEEKTFAGNGSTEADIVTVELTGVTLADLTMENGFISAGELA